MARPLPKEAYAPLLALVRSYRLWPARAAVYIPAVGVIVGVVAAGTSFKMKADAQTERVAFIAERATTVGAPTTFFADLLPEPPIAFVAGLCVVGAIGIAVFLGVATTLRNRMQREARRLDALA